MRHLLLLAFSVIFTAAFSQTPNNCGNYTSTGTLGSIYISGSNAVCNSNVPGTVTGSGAWTGGTCAGNIVTTVVGPPVSCLTVSYTSVNTNDFATLTTDTGGSLTITGVNVGVSGNVIGPYQCASGTGTSGDVLVNICSTIPFSVLTLTNTGCASGWIINCATSTLPVELINFQAEASENGEVRLNWSTAAEIDNDYFVIERSQDAVNFEPLREIDGAGNSSVVQTYRDYDDQPYMGTSYYRLKQVDFDGSFSYSDVHSVSFDGFEFVNLYPNPVEDELELQVAVVKSSELNVAIVDYMGRNVYSTRKTVSAGSSAIKIDVTQLNTGMYTLQIVSSNGEFISKALIRN